MNSDLNQLKANLDTVLRWYDFNMHDCARSWDEGFQSPTFRYAMLI